MASSKEIQHSSRPLSQHRLSMSTTPGSLPKSHSRNHSHSVSSGSLITNHRVSRRKSVSSNTASNVAAMVAAVREAGDNALGIPISNRRNTMSKTASARAAILGSLPSPPASLPSNRIRLTSSGKSDPSESAIDDQNDEIDDDEETGFNQSRVRRASEGQHLMKEGKKNELKCDKCGKGYKHVSCLKKHEWEHTPQWSYTSKLLISKHQQVQLLEAASVLVSMNQEDGTTPPDSAKDFHSASPSSSEHGEGISSADTTPPPQTDMFNAYSRSYTGQHKHSFSRSYQSTNGIALGHHRQTSSGHNGRPLSSISLNKEDENLAAALLSCSFGTPRTVPVTLQDAPEVPPIPAQYLNQPSFGASSLTRQTESYTRHGDVKMEESEEDDEYDHSRARSDEDDDGVFGRMEE